MINLLGSAVAKTARVLEKQSAPLTNGDDGERTRSREGLDEQGGGGKPPLGEPGKKMASQVPAEKPGPGGERASLSLRVGLETGGEKAVRFHRAGGSGELVLQVQEKLFVRTLRWFFVTLGLLAAWISRRATGSRHAVAVVVGLALPIGLSGLVPLAWTPILDGVMLGTLAASAVWILPLASDGRVRAAVVRPLGVERSQNHLVLENLTVDEITATTVSGAAQISIDSVPETLAENVRRQAVLAYRITGENARVVWERHVREQEMGLPASINLVDLTTVVHADGRYRARAAYNIRNFTLQFLEVLLPPESEVWSVHVSGQPVRPAKLRKDGRTITLLPLQKIIFANFMASRGWC